MLELSDVTVSYGRIDALKGISLSVKKGEIVALIGANGAGKSTTLMAVSGIAALRSGAVFYEGNRISGSPAHEIVRTGISQVPEGRRIFGRMTVTENLEMGAFSRSRQEAGDGLKRVFDMFPVLAERSRQLGGTLSGGEQQMLALARALMSKPRLLLLDEPSLGLAPMVVREFFRTVRDLNEREGLTVLVVEQDARIALSISARAYVLEVGRVALTGTSAELRDDEAVRRSYLGY
jgi:branched-chain amino acid transport system ATP-binding protein